MYVCIMMMHACTHTCMYACMHVCMCACMHACAHACMYVCMYVPVCMHARMHANVCSREFVGDTQPSLSEPLWGGGERAFLTTMSITGSL